MSGDCRHALCPFDCSESETGYSSIHPQKFVTCINCIEEISADRFELFQFDCGKSENRPDGCFSVLCTPVRRLTATLPHSPCQRKAPTTTKTISETLRPTLFDPKHFMCIVYMFYVMLMHPEPNRIHKDISQIIKQ